MFDFCKAFLSALNYTYLKHLTYILPLYDVHLCCVCVQVRFKCDVILAAASVNDAELWMVKAAEASPMGEV